MLLYLTLVLEKQMVLKEKHTKAQKKMIIKAHKKVLVFYLPLS